MTIPLHTVHWDLTLMHNGVKFFPTDVAAGATMRANEDSVGTEAWLSNLAPTSRQSWSALAFAAVLAVGCAVLIPLASRPLPRFDGFIPAFEATVFVTDLIISVLLFAQFSIHQSRALLALASGYLFTALIVIPHILTFQGAFSPTGLLGAGLQTSAWLYVFWHIGLPTALLAYAWLKDDKRAKFITQWPTSTAISSSVVIVVSLVCGLTLLATVGEHFLPRLILDSTHFSPFVLYTAVFLMLICVAALVALLARRRSVLDQWLMIVTLAAILELLFTGVLSPGRFSLGFYAGRLFALVTSTVVLVVLLAETTKLYARLARSNAMLQRERNNKLMNLEAVAASISHEVRQPLSAITANGSALLRFLDHAPPNLDEARSAAERMISEGHRASQVLDNLRDLFGKSDQAQEQIDANEIALGALRVLREELRDHHITTRVELMPGLPPVLGHKGQLQEVIINLVNNAIEAMDSIRNDRRVLRVSTEDSGSGALIMTVEDSGPGIDPRKLDHIFDAFVTTKPHGTGLGLAICRMIVERHEGRLSALPADPHGTVFRVALPVRKHAVA
jgi:signal transduction histidine kinase